MVTDQLPFPPRNGVTIPVYNYAIGLMARHSLKLLLMADEHSPVNPMALAENEAVFGKIEVIYVRRKSRAARLLAEVFGGGMYKEGWAEIKPTRLPNSHLADALIVSPFSAVAKWEAAKLDDDVSFRVRVAAVSDCTTAEYYFRSEQSFGRVGLAAKGILDRLRSCQIAKAEARSLERYHHVLMQTKTDLALMHRLVSKKIAERAIRVPNGVSPAFFQLSPASHSKTAVFIAELSGEYAPIAQWLVAEVWPQVMRRNSACRLLIVGRGATAQLKAAIELAQGVSHIQYVEDLGAMYGQVAVAICPVFKGYGLINKTLEAMAAGVPVVGGIAAFNGIEGFESDKHGIACRPRHADDFSAAICRLITDSELRMRVGAAARELVAEQFRWEAALNSIEVLFGAEPLRCIDSVR